LRALLSEEFTEARIDTGLIGRNPEWAEAVSPTQEAIDQAASSMLHHSAIDSTIAVPGFRLNAPDRTEVAMMLGGEVILGDAARPAAGVLQRNDGATVWLNEAGETFALRPFAARGTGQASAADGAILAPMPGKVIAVDVWEGQPVTAGQRLMVLEAMKMEHALTAPFDGVVAEMSVSAGSQVQVEAVLACVVPASKE
jgi:3-methylcrotonyl-CoA carboxylase alpha subunit